MASAGPLRRWKTFIAAFGLVDAAIEAAAGGGPAPALSRAAFRSARAEVVEMLCGAPAGSNGVAEELCVVLDGFMAESLVTLRSVPAGAVPRVLASSAGLAAAVAALRRHESGRVRGLARDVVGCWKNAVEGVIAEASAALRELDQLLLPSDNNNKDTAPVMAPGPVPVKAAAAAQGSHPQPKKKTTSAVAGCDPMTMEKAATKTAGSLPRKKTTTTTPPPAAAFVRRAAGNGRPEPDEKMESTKRKLREGYQEFEDAKRKRKIRVIEAPKMTEQRQRKMHPILRERSRARCGGNSTAVSRCLFPSLQRI